MTDSTRRYSDEEFALIIRKASQPLDPASPSTPATEATGLTLDEIRAIAADVGLDPERVAAAAASIPATGDGTQDRSLLGEARYQLQVEVPRQVPEDDLVEIFEVARQQLGQRGSLHEVMGSLEWSSQDDVVQYHVSLSRRTVEPASPSVLSGRRQHC